MTNEENKLVAEKDFDTRLKRAKGIEGKKDISLPKQTEKGLALRVSTELVVAVLVGGGIGFGLDRYFGTEPWLLVVFLFLGNAAGIWNIFRLTNNQGDSLGFRQNGRR